MRGKTHGLMLAAALATGAGLLAGCVVAPAPMPMASADVYAPVAPPPPQAEVVPPLPFAGAIWINGYWNWSGGRHVWVPGYYARPRPGYHWQPRRWMRQRGGGWALRGGWER